MIDISLKNLARIGGLFLLTLPSSLQAEPLRVRLPTGDIPILEVEGEGGVSLRVLGPRLPSWFRRSPDGVEDFLRLDARPPREELRYRVELSKNTRLRMIEGTQVLEFLDPSGAPRVRVLPPWVASLDERGQPGPKRFARIRVEGCRLDTSPVAPWGRSLPLPGASSCVVVVDWSGVSLSYPALVDPAWTSATTMAQEHANHGAVVLDDGRVLVAGGAAGSANASEGPKPYLAEIYDPSSNTWATTGSPLKERDTGFRLVAIPGGALLAGGIVPLAEQAERYNLATGTWSMTPPLSTCLHAVALRLPDQRVLVAGGQSNSILNRVQFGNQDFVLLLVA